MEGQSTEVACLTFTHPFSYWAAAEHGWHWNTLSTVSQAVHVKKPGTRRHYSPNVTFYCHQYKTESCALHTVIICVTVMHTGAAAWKLFLWKAFVSTFPTSTQLGLWNIPVIILKYKHIISCLPVLFVALSEVCASDCFHSGCFHLGWQVLP